MLSVAACKQRGSFRIDVNFAVPTPGVVALFGRSGCGKSSVVDLIAGLAEPDAGRIEVDDVVLYDSERGIRLAAERRRIGYVFQDARLFPHLSVAANLRYGERRADGLRYISLDSVATAHPRRFA